MKAERIMEVSVAIVLPFFVGWNLVGSSSVSAEPPSLKVVVSHTAATRGDSDTPHGGSASTTQPQQAPAMPAPNSWPMFRGGPTMAGIARGTLPEKLALKWAFKTQGPIKSSAVIDKGRVFIGSDDGNLYAISLVDGKKIWSFKAEGAIEAPPTVAGGMVYVGSADTHLYCVVAETGAMKWKFHTEDKILGAAGVVRLGDRTLVLVGSYDNHLYCVDAADGRKVWSYATDNYINGSPAISQGKVIFGGCDGVLHVVSVEDGRKLGGVEVGSYIAGTAALSGARAYVGHYEGGFVCVDVAQGKIAWEYPNEHREHFPFFSSAAVDDRHVVFGGRDKRLHCVARDDGKPLWTFQARGKIDSSPVICGNKIVVGSDDGRLYIVNLADGKELWSYEIGDAITGSPAVASGIIVVGCEDGSVYAFEAKR